MPTLFPTTPSCRHLEINIYIFLWLFLWPSSFSTSFPLSNGDMSLIMLGLITNLNSIICVCVCVLKSHYSMPSSLNYRPCFECQRNVPLDRARFVPSWCASTHTHTHFKSLSRVYLCLRCVVHPQCPRLSDLVSQLFSCPMDSSFLYLSRAKV